MKLTKENVYINLQGKTKEELTDLYDFLKNNNEPIFKTKERFLEYNDYYLAFFGEWQQMFRIDNEVEVTIQELKEIVKPTETLQEKEQRLLEELEEVRKEIEEEDKIKVGDWVIRTNNGIKKGIELFKADDTYDYRYINSEKRVYQKITNTELIKLLEQEIK